MSTSLIVVVAVAAMAAGQVPATDPVRLAIDRSLPFIQTEGQRWIDNKKCVTCHQVPFMVWALHAAADRGLAVDQEKLQAWDNWATDWKHLATKQQLEEGERPALTGQPDTVSQLLLGRSARQRALPADSWPALFAECLATAQLADGSWKAGGQLPGQKRPERETNEVTTMWALVALRSYAKPDQSLETRLQKAGSWLGDQTQGQSTEWWAARLLLKRGNGTDAAGTEANRVREELIKRQRADGGWGWLSADESDAFGTGVALYALARDGLAADHSSIALGRSFLIKTQQPDGSWPVKGTKKAKANSVEPTATYWGTCWAVIGLAETLPLPSP